MNKDHDVFEPSTGPHRSNSSPPWSGFPATPVSRIRRPGSPRRWRASSRRAVCDRSSWRSSPAGPTSCAPSRAARRARTSSSAATPTPCPSIRADPGHGFSGAVHDGRLFGRGAVDMKGAVAAMAAALVALRRTGLLAAGRVTLAAVIDEETESLGAEHLINSGFTADGAIVGEPTKNQICIGHKGLEWLEIVFTGKAAHGGTPAAGINAIDAAASFVQRVRTGLLPEFAARADDLLGPPTFNFGTVRGGDQPSTVAASCVLTADRRSVPGENYELMCAELESILAAVRAEMPGLGTELRRLPGGMATLEHVALKTAPSEAIVEAVAAAHRRVTGRDGEYGAFPAWTDGALLSAFAGIPTLILGPGDLAVAHSPEESVETAQVIEAARIYALTAAEFCGRTK